MATQDTKDTKAKLGPGGTQVKQFENLKTLLKNAKSTSGTDLYMHLQEVFKKLILHYPD